MKPFVILHGQSMRTTTTMNNVPGVIMMRLMFNVSMISFLIVAAGCASTSGSSHDDYYGYHNNQNSTSTQTPAPEWYSSFPPEPREPVAAMPTDDSVRENEVTQVGPI